MITNKRKKQQPIKIKLQEDNSNYQTNNTQFTRNSCSNNKYQTLHSNSNNYRILSSKERQNKSFNCDKIVMNELLAKKKQSSKSVKKIIKNDKQKYQQYCLIDQTFVKITKEDQRNITQTFLMNTASSTHGFIQYKQNQEKIKNQEKKMKKKAKKIKQQVNKQQLNRRQFKPIQVNDAQIDAILHYNEIGLQYSQRRNAQYDITKIQCVQEPQCNMLKGLLKSIQNAKNIDQQQLLTISPTQAQFYSLILKNLLNHLDKSKVDQKSLENHDKSSINIQNPHKQIQYDDEQQTKHTSSELKIMKQIQQIQNLIYLRQYKQLSYLDQSNTYENGQINTNLLSVISFLCQIFAYVQVNHNTDFLNRIKKIYGLSYKHRFYRITRGFVVDQDQQFQIIDSQIFNNFIQSSRKDNMYEQIHLKAVFDGLNQHLQQYRPYYIGNGQPFNWSLKMYPNISQYSIDEESMPIIFQQTKQKMVQWCASICGIIIQSDSKNNCVLKAKKKQSQDKFIYNWIKNDNFQKNNIENYSTQILYQMGEWIFDEIIDEFRRQFQSLQ